METLRQRNVNGMLPNAIHAVKEWGVEMPSRNGKTLEFNQPVSSCYLRPTERVLFCPQRDANPFFHFFESLWMLAGRNDLEFPSRFSKNITQFSDDGETLNGSAYGKRWKDYFTLHNQESGLAEGDQLSLIVGMLQRNELDRRVVLTMWSPEWDLNSSSKDVPCNLMVVFRTRPNTEQNNRPELTMTVYNRSNDIVYGAYGANAVHFSVLLEYVAGLVGLPVGPYWQVSNSLHAYTETEVWNRVKDVPFCSETDLYDPGLVKPYPMFDKEVPAGFWDQDLFLFFEDPFCNGFRHSFFSRIARPMMAAHTAYKRKDRGVALEALSQMPEDNDWRMACEQWMKRRWNNADSRP